MFAWYTQTSALGGIPDTMVLQSEFEQAQKAKIRLSKVS